MIASLRLKDALLAGALFIPHPAGHAVDAVSAEIATGNRTQLLRLGMQFFSPYDFMAGANTHVALAWELSAAYFQLHHPANESADSTSLVDFGITPILRLTGKEKKGCYGEVGIGLHGLSHRYNNNGRELSTTLQFVSHLSLGYEFVNGVDLSLNIQHMSNGGFKRPNDGANFVALRVMQRF
jgi:lipid A 3-O-deacylase